MKNSLVLFMLLTIFSCTSKKEYKKTTPEWSKNSIMYEVNIRQYTPEGTFNSFSKHLARIKDLGVDIIWFMPIHPIGEKNRKGSLGSYYSVKDYKSVNPEFGTIEDFNRLVEKIHQMGMKVIIDWVANHSSFDNTWVENGNLDWYSLDSLGQLQPPIGTDWWDVADLNFDNYDMRKEMIECMKYWLVESNIDGFRCDVADWVPLDFWEDCRKELDEVKDVFMLAEAENPKLHNNAFDMTYAWHFHFVMNEIASQKKSVYDIIDYLNNKATDFPNDAYRLHFTSNHDENSWKGYAEERLGDAVKTFAALSVTIEGMPLIYSGQEASLDKRLEFFEKDTISWVDLSLSSFYKTLFELKKNNPALWNGNYGGKAEVISSVNDSLSFAFIREKNNNKVLSIFNFSDKPATVELSSDNLRDSYNCVFTQNKKEFSEKENISLSPWEFLIYTK